MLLMIYPMLSHVISSWSLGQDVSKNVCYFDLVAMVTIQGLSLAKNCNKPNSKTKGCVTMKIGIDGKYT